MLQIYQRVSWICFLFHHPCSSIWWLINSIAIAIARTTVCLDSIMVFLALYIRIRLSSFAHHSKEDGILRCHYGCRLLVRISILYCLLEHDTDTTRAITFKPGLHSTICTDDRIFHVLNWYAFMWWSLFYTLSLFAREERKFKEDEKIIK